jgi:hypothetical protein
MKNNQSKFPENVQINGNTIICEGFLENGWDGELYLVNEKGKAIGLDEIIGDGYKLLQEDKPKVKITIELLSK